MKCRYLVGPRICRSNWLLSLYAICPASQPTSQATIQPSSQQSIQPNSQPLVSWMAGALAGSAHGSSRHHAAVTNKENDHPDTHGLVNSDQSTNQSTEKEALQAHTASQLPCVLFCPIKQASQQATTKQPAQPANNCLVGWLVGRFAGWLA